MHCLWICYFQKDVCIFLYRVLLASYGGLDITAIALFGVCVAFVLNFYINNKENNQNPQLAINTLTEGEIDFE